MFKNILFYTLKGINGWSYYTHKTVNVAIVSSIKCHKRLFCIFDRDYKYSLTIGYGELVKCLGVGFGKFRDDNGIKNGFAIYICDGPNQVITKRYKTLEDANIDMNEILKKQKYLNDKDD